MVLLHEGSIFVMKFKCFPIFILVDSARCQYCALEEAKIKHEMLSVLVCCVVSSSPMLLSIYRNRAESIKAGNILDDYFSLPLNIHFLI